MGETHSTSSSPPQFTVRGATVGRQYEGQLQPVSAGDVQITARYPAPGLYPVPPGAATRPRRVLVDDQISQLVRAGEQEHSNDFHLAYHNVYETVASVINVLAAQPAKTGPNVRDVNRQWRQALHNALPAPLKAPVGEIPPNAPWTQMVARLNGLSNERDTNHWHDMHAGFAPTADRRAHHIPDAEELLRILPAARSAPTAPRRASTPPPSARD